MTGNATLEQGLWQMPWPQHPIIYRNKAFFTVDRTSLYRLKTMSSVIETLLLYRDEINMLLKT